MRTLAFVAAGLVISAIACTAGTGAFPESTLGNEKPGAAGDLPSSSNEQGTTAGDLPGGGSLSISCDAYYRCVGQVNGKALNDVVHFKTKDGECVFDEFRVGSGGVINDKNGNPVATFSRAGNSFTVSGGSFSFTCTPTDPPSTSNEGDGGGKVEVDAGNPVFDSGTPATDAALPVLDAGGGG